MRSDPYHEPVLVKEALSYLAPTAGALVFDGTLGAGGHARAVLEHCGDCRVLGCDWDPDAVARARGALAEFGDRIAIELGRFDQVIESRVATARVDGAILDLGLSSHQVDEASRGFSFRPGLPLDMRMDRDSARPTAADLLNEAPERRLAEIFRSYGEERRASPLARAIGRRRARRSLATSDDVVAAMSVAFGRAPSQRDKARIFQALRIAVNEELDVLARGLDTIREALAPLGTVVVISYHSLEDRVVKRAFREWSASCVCPPELPVCACRGRALGDTLTRKPVRPGAAEVQRNPRARSARLRAWRRAA